MVIPCSLSARNPSVRSQVHIFVPPLLTGLFNRLKLVFENGFRVIEQPPYQSGFSVINRASCRKTQQVHIQIAANSGFLFCSHSQKFPG